VRENIHRTSSRRRSGSSSCARRPLAAASALRGTTAIVVGVAATPDMAGTVAGPDGSRLRLPGRRRRELVGRIAVMGAGSWGTVFAGLGADAGEDVVLWARRPELAAEIAQTRRNSAYLGDLPVHPAVHVTADAEEAAARAEVVVLAVPSGPLRSCLRAWAGFLPRDAVYVSLVKGIEVASRQRASEIVRDELGVPADRVVVV